ncbi:hypothetical protein W97_06105 [Coniosporium apollinis CBS 100218]|uniref:RINT-1 family protein n=1 Tax=Coniosporium apollinis (strain CBS 100218) TaxID=1168221 RepID=R7YYW8_CONA1|nr:uncharacterized protein W97_06105 [Coniosporium apollinis CBS 100218]EON66989.1 hypothetical protein W97_06105 [Coniosporium apollinis CBS 100218]
MVPTNSSARPQKMQQPEDRDVRVGDYLDDKLQTLADLESVDSLLAGVRDRHELLQKQLEDARLDLQTAKGSYSEYASSSQRAAREFAKKQQDIDRRLKIIAQSDTSDDAVGKFESSMDKLRRLDIASGYMELLQEVEKINSEGRTRLQTSPEAAMEQYRQLRKLTASLAPLADAAEGAAPHLLDHISKTTENLHRQIKDAFSAELEQLLKKIYWPRADATIPPNLQQDWEKSTGKLLDLQKPELEALESAATTKDKNKAPAVLLPLEVLVQPLEMRFRFHFEGDRPTNRLDKPEYFLSYVADLLSQYNDFMVDNLQPILLRHFRGSDLGMNPAYIDATSALITALLPMLRAKVFSMLPQVASQPQLLSHLIQEIMSFDTAIRDEWRYSGGSGVEGWKGIAWEVLVQKDWFGRWLQVEKEFALSRYQSIIDDPSAGELDYDSVDPDATKPSKAAIRVNDLLETITDRYRPLSSFSQKLRFLIDIQISIFDRFHERLHSGLEAYLTLTSSIGRRVQGISQEEQASLQGVAGLDRLCRVYGSAEYLEKAMRDWSDDIFFLDLWTELQQRVSRPPSTTTPTTRTSTPIAGALSLSDIATSTSPAVGTTTNGALFDETAAAYSRLRIRSEAIITDTLIYDLRAALRGYQRANPRGSISATTAAVSSTSAELDPALSYLAASLHFLSHALARAPLLRITRALCRALDEALWDGVLMRHRFSAAGAAQLAADFAALCAAIDNVCGTGVAERGMRRMGEAVGLVGLRASRGQAGGMQDGEEEEGEEAGERERRLGLWEVERRLFANNESAREVLEEFGVERLSEAEARHVLERRVELGS